MSILHRKRAVLLFLLIFLASAPWASAQAAGAQAGQKAPLAPPGLDALVAKVMKTFEVPGIGLAIVKDGSVVLAKGFGVRKMGEAAPVDAGTLFAIASNTKVFTAAALGMLVDQGKLSWDGRVIDYLPWFQLGDPYVTRELTIRDLLVHRSGLGLGAGDLLIWPPSEYSRREIARRLRYVPLARSFRSAYAYDNVLYLVAGEVVEAVSGLTWEEFVAGNIFKELGMAASQVRYSPTANSGNVAGPHARVEGVVRIADPSTSDNTNPAGGINSNAEDMAKWILVLLKGGRLADGSRLFSEKTAQELVALVTPMPNPLPAPELMALRANFRGYALGLNVHDYRGKKVVTHTGGLTGYVSKVTMLPEINLGMAVLTNQESGEAYSSLTWHIVDYYLGAPSTDWVTAYTKVRERTQARYAESLKKASEARAAASKPSLALEKYAGTYQDAWYGDIVIVFEGGRLVMRFTKTPGLVGDLEHWQYDTFVVRWRNRELRADAFVSFALNPDGGVDRAKMKAVSEETDFSYDFQDLLLIRRDK